ncbi:hypothetical protein FPZ43_15680 [Mucilaginibacter pallidiroseus]|uniref:Uncharacterized protein n=1 Tax=Mucilaginibacter pallidiroseus TaxID=2599295 RepID=A0A563U318_9SPHI|nr:hypothetical protein [Mucilaginibacter pallidiroseus]TWR25725.1 hypothetical protein FPZ43_15680 [Mucilaginibacter pallidiroseus]
MTNKYILKPGLHQFIPGSAAKHCNGSLSDEEASWYLKRYPHIANLFVMFPSLTTEQNSSQSATKKRRNRITKLVAKSSLPGGKAEI